jgi:hypothetical protein
VAPAFEAQKLSSVDGPLGHGDDGLMKIGKRGARLEPLGSILNGAGQ